MRSHYSRDQLAQALRELGLRAGDKVFSHSNVGLFGIPAEGGEHETVCEVVLGAFLDVLGPSGTLLVPTFSYSFGKGLPYDPANTPSECGFFSDWFRQQPGVIRSWDPFFSVAAIGPAAEALTADVPAECFGFDSVWDRFRQAGGVFCNLNYHAGSTFFHFVERRLACPYRYDKLFAGELILNGESRPMEAVFFCRDGQFPASAVAVEPFDQLIRQKGLVRSTRVGRGRVDLITAADMYRLIEETLAEHPWFLTVSWDKVSMPPFEAEPDGVQVVPALDLSAGPKGLVEALWPLARDWVSEGHDAALSALGRVLDVRVHRFPTGSHCGNDIVPERWACHTGRVETADGSCVLDYAESLLHVASYSASFSGEVSRSELLAHVKTDDRWVEAVPYCTVYPWKAWQLAATRQWAEALPEGRYRVSLETSARFGSLKVGEVVRKGLSDRRLLLLSHLGHPGSANGGLSGVAVALEVMRRLAELPPGYLTLHWLVLPARFGLGAYLQQSSDVWEGALCLDALGHDDPLVLATVADEDHWLAIGNDVVPPLQGDGRNGRTTATSHPLVTQLLAAQVMPVTVLARWHGGEVDALFAGQGTSLDVPHRLDNGRLEEAVQIALAWLRKVDQAAGRASR